MQLLPIDDDVIVLEEYYHFPRDRSNVYRLAAALAEVWSAERRKGSSTDVYTALILGPTSADGYSGPLILAEGEIRAHTCDGFACVLDARTGRIIRQVFTK